MGIAVVNVIFDETVVVNWTVIGRTVVDARVVSNAAVVYCIVV